jgi:hypothetical protein
LVLQFTMVALSLMTGHRPNQAFCVCAFVFH